MLEKRLEKHIDLLIERYPVLEACKEDIISGYELLEECLQMEESCRSLNQHTRLGFSTITIYL